MSEMPLGGSRESRDSEGFGNYTNRDMADQLPGEEPRRDSETSRLEQGHKPKAPASPPEESEPATPRKLTAEEQMALYEKELKEEDWGHQPC